MRVTTLIENRPSESDARLAPEWGLSLHVNFNNRNILFDTGASGSFIQNAEYLSINMANVDVAILSHHHFDHGGGLKRFLEVNSTAKVYLGEVPHGRCYIRPLPFIKKYVGLDPTLATGYPERLVTLKEPTEVLPDVFVFPHISGKYVRPAGNKRLFVLGGGKMVLDDFAHEIVMAIRENNQLIVFTGCSHNGVLNMVDTVAREFTGLPVKAVVGGLHLVTSPPFNMIAGGKPQVAELAKAILEYPIDQTYTGHCTGIKAFAILKTIMGDRLTDIHTGSCFEIN
jgi:7,8-dihydropterin-6-yl-methyl-4-(beta-D-ribofuranosyl)aminobenzene 5'-phosphate synthase